ncbi:Regulatory protein TetR [Sphingomonas paucimobilis]|nr:Regulatory protein TetR [Sphingomonas paucimobilis]
MAMPRAGDDVSMKVDTPRAPQRGRPRRLELEQVLKAALAVGLQQLTMSAVAERLGVAKAVLYGYVANREELVRLAAAFASRHHDFPSDEGQPWSTWVLEYARALFETMTMEGELLETWLNGGQSPFVEVDAGELWLSVLTRRGFSGDEALQLRRAVSHIVIGAAAAAKRDRNLRAEGRPRAAGVKKALLSRTPEEAPLLRQFLNVFSREVNEHNWEYGLFILLKGVTVARDALALENGDSRHPFEALAF